MKRSAVNEIIREADAFIRSFGYVLPPFANLTPQDMQDQRDQLDDIIERRMGWDITDYGEEKFDDLGLVLFTVRNGLVKDLAQGRGMLYAEKIMISKKDQYCPMHRHYHKAEDIINRGGGVLAMELFASDAKGQMDHENPVSLMVDGVRKTFKAGEVLALKPGESATLMPGVWHAFWGEGADVLVGEVSTVNDDEKDNHFRDPIGRFSDIEEDEAAYRLLVSDYDRVLKA